jgi:hypothetical protein
MRRKLESDMERDREFGIGNLEREREFGKWKGIERGI